MAITADKVVTILEVQDQAYIARLDKDAQHFQAKMQEILSSAEKAGMATSITFDQASGAFVKAGKGAQQAGQGLKFVGAEGRAAQQQMRNLAFQFQDIGTMLAAGQSPFMLLAQQLPQVTMYGGQLTGVMGALRSTVAGLLSPLGLATTAFVLLGSTAISYFSSAGAETEKLSDILKRHEELIRSLGPAYEHALQKAREYSESPEVAAALVRDSVDDAAQKLSDLVGEALQRINYALDQGVRDAMAEGISDITEAYSASRFAPFYELIERFTEGTINAREFREEVARMGNATPELAVAARELRVIVDEAANATREVANMVQEFDDAATLFGDLQNAIDAVESGKARKELQELYDKAKDGEIGVDDVRKALGNLSGFTPDLSGAIGEISRLFEQAIATQNAIANLSAGGGAGPRTRGRYRGDPVLPETAPTPDRRVDPYFEDWRTKERGGGRKRENEYERLTGQIERRTKALESETPAQAGLNPLIDDYGYAAEKAKLEAQLLVAAEQAKIEITPAVRQAIEATAEGYALATAAARELAEEQREALRSAEEWLNVGQDVTKGFIDDLINGKSAAESFASAISKIGDALIDDVLSAIFDIKNASGGGFLGFLGGLFGLGGRGGGFFPSAPGAGLYADGGYTGNGGKYEPKGVVHGGEYVFSKDAVQKAGVGNLEALHRSLKGYANGGFVAPSIPSMARSSASSAPQDVRIAIDVSGARGNTEIMEMVGAGVREGLRQYDREAGPSMVKRVVNDPRAVG